MSTSNQRAVHPAASALAILLVFAGVQAVWWRFLVYHDHAKGIMAGRPPMMQGPEPSVTVLGHADISVTTLAGTEEPGSADGPGYAARFDRPTGLAINDNGDLYVADTGNNRIRLVRPTGETSTAAGLDAGFADGSAGLARFNMPCGIALGPNSAIYVADTGNHRIRQIAADGTTSTVCGGDSGYADGPFATARFSFPCSVATGPNGAIFVADAGNHCVRQILNGQATTLFGRDDTVLQNLSPQSLPYASKGPPAGSPAGAPGHPAITPSSGAPVVPGRPLASPVSVCGAPVLAAAVPSTGTMYIGGRSLNNIPIRSDQSLTPKQAAALRLNRPVAVCAFEDGWLVIDDSHAAVFFVRNGVAEVIAGRCNSKGAQLGLVDGSGELALFGTLGGIATDGKRYAYVAETSNNAIRRLDISELARTGKSN